ncbi:hypothetical protein ACLVWQ_18385 [Streptomyces sp. CWNU-52B]|uniref:hypothetical protein n=1 Tax=unclassified Streptomyces TaxID=2593676 RepID=UPI0039C2B0B6
MTVKNGLTRVAPRSRASAGEAFDLLNCGWYGVEGDALNSSLSCAAAIPIVGWGATGGK